MMWLRPNSAAATDSLKKCATLLGVGLYLYSSVPESSNGKGKVQSYDQQQQTASNNGQKGTRQASTPQTINNDKTRISNKQLNYLLDLGKEIRLDSKGLDQRSLEEFGVRMAYLTRRDASAFIDSLKRKAA